MKKGAKFYILATILWYLSASIFEDTCDYIYYACSGLAHLSAALFFVKNLGINQKKYVLILSKWFVFVAAQNLADEILFNPLKIENFEYILCFSALIVISLKEYKLFSKSKK